MIHAVKIEPKHFEDVISGKKPFEVRKNDRDYRECDYIALNEHEPETAASNGGYTGRSALFRVSHILDNPAYCKEGYIIMGLRGCLVGCNRWLKPEHLLHGQARGGGGK